MSTKKFFFAGKYCICFKVYLVMIIIASLFYACDDPIEPIEFNTHNKILFTSSRSGKEQLFMMNPDGSDIKQITFGEYSHSKGRWSPDAQKIVCNTDQNITTAGMQMVVMNVDGSNRKLLGVGSQMSWSPDGNRIVFSFMPRAELGDISSYIFVINMEGNNLIQLTNVWGASDNTPSWSPDGEEIAFSSNRDDSIRSLKSDIYLMKNDGSNQYRLTTIENGVGSLQWSPNGYQIAFVSGGICLIEKTGSNFNRILEDINGFGVYRLPIWSPNSEQLVFTRITSDGNANKNIYKIRNNGMALEKILDDPTAYATDWAK